MKNAVIIAIIGIMVLIAGYFLFADKTPGREDEGTVAPTMSFFITSRNPGSGANLGGLAGADAHCTLLAESVGVTGKTWRAYLSTTAAGGAAAVNARDRIGAGPWHNAKGELIAATLEELHGMNNINKTTALTENGETVSGRGDTVNTHDILTGSGPDGRVKADATGDTTCANWTSAGAGSAIVGHHDRMGIDDSEPMKSWNSSHTSSGCSMENLKSTGGGGLFYCFAQ